MRPYSNDLRGRVVAAMEGGMSCRAAAARYGVAPSTAGNWHRLYCSTKSYLPLPVGGDRRSKLLNEVEWIAAHLAATPDLRLLDVQRALAGRGVAVSYSGVQRTVKRLGLRFKKTIDATEQDRPDVALARQLWRAEQAGLDFARLVPGWCSSMRPGPPRR